MSNQQRSTLLENNKKKFRNKTAIFDSDDEYDPEQMDSEEEEMRLLIE